MLSSMSIDQLTRVVSPQEIAGVGGSHGLVEALRSLRTGRGTQGQDLTPGALERLSGITDELYRLLAKQAILARYEP